jgi:hypothetical protein
VARKPLTVGAHSFAKQADCAEHCKQMLAGYVIGDIVEGDDAAFLRALIERHPEADEKIGVGIHYFFIGPNDAGSYHGFRICRVDGTVIDFSYRACVTGRSPAASTSARRAMRHAIVQQILDFRSTHPPVCAVTGRALTPDVMHIDHQEPNTFAVLVERFLALNCLTIDDVKSESCGEGCMLSDRDFAARWAAYHQRHAKLRVVHKNINMGWETGEGT